jgi:hypothetical protein
MIYPFCFSCNRDYALSELMKTTLEKYCKTLAIPPVIINTDHRFPFYENGAGWNASMLKVGYMCGMVDQLPIGDDDYILSVDSDVVFTSSDVFDHITGADIIGIKHDPPYITKFGYWSHMSGALIFIRGATAKAIANLTPTNMDYIRQTHLRPFDMTENEDVVLSYLVRYVNGNSRKLPNDLSSGDFESDLLDGKLKSFYHLNYMPEQFLGEPVTGKWDIPKVLKNRGIKL